MGEVIAGHVLDVLAALPAESVSCVVTSPPYWSLRKYDAPDVVWGGDPECPHTLEAAPMAGEGYTGTKRWNHGATRAENPEAWMTETRPLLTGGKSKKQSTNAGSYVADQYGNRVAECAECSKCGAWRGQYGLEPTPELYVEHSLMVLRAIRRVLRPDGCVWWNIGDGYAASRSYQVDGTKQTPGSQQGLSLAVPPGLKPKDLILMPERVALAAQADGWWVRSRIIWHKPNAMPESVRDRPTNAHETIWMLTKNARYWWDADAVREGLAASTLADGRNDTGRHTQQSDKYAEGVTGAPDEPSWYRAKTFVNPVAGRNVRDVWTFPTAQTPEAHFATFPIALPLRCIAAACPREVCATCGKARTRIVETSRPTNSAGHDPTMETGRGGMNRERKGPALKRIRGREGELAARVAVAIKGNEELADALFGRTRWGHWCREDAGGVRVPSPEHMRVLVERFGLDERVPDELVNGESGGWTDCGHDDYQPGVVLDPFAGLATTGLAALRLGRRFIGIELSEKYAELARRKLTRWWEDTRLVEADVPEPQMALEL